MMNKVLCMILVLVMMLSVVMISVNAAEVDEADNGAIADDVEVGVDVDVEDSGATEEIAEVGADVDVSTSAYSVPNETDFLSILSTLRSKYPNGGRWSGTYYENGVAKAWQCHGYACQLVYEVFGAQYYNGGFSSKLTYSMGTLNAGDLVRINSDSHSIFITKVTSDRIYFTDANYDYNNGIRWDASYTVSEMRNKFTYKMHLSGNTLTGNGTPPVPKPSNAWVNYKYSAIPTGTANYFTFGATNATSYNIRIDKDGVQWTFDQGVTSGKGYMFWDAGNYTVWTAAINSSGLIESYKMNFTVFVPITLGQSFVAEITNSKGAMNLSGTDNYNTVLETKSDSDSQKWRFELQSNNTYKITNVQYGLCMDVVNSKTEAGTNIGIWNDNSMNAQRYYIRQTTNGYAIVPMVNTGLALDIDYESLANGTNISDYTYHGRWNQSFSIDPIDITPSVTQEYNGHTYEYYEMAVPWEQAVRICEKKGGHLVSITSQEENDVVKGMISSNIWLGARAFDKDNSWYWTNCEKATFTNWSSGQPDYYKDIEYYAMMYSDTGKWNDYPHTTSIYFVCEYDNGDVNAENYSPSKTIERNGVTYGIFDYAVDWQTAEAICEAKGGHLVKIDSAEKNQTFIELMNEGGKDEYWFDATDRFSEGIWTDHEGSLLEYVNWSEGEPNNDFNIEQYGFMMKSSDQWADLKGFSPIYRSTGFICEYEPKTAILGDADGDGDVSAIDVTLIQRYNAFMDTGIDESVMMNGDVDGNGLLETIDATWIQRYLVYMDVPYAIGEKK